MQDFHTFREYMNKFETLLTASMEDYLEMIYRLSLKSGYTRMHDLAISLNVQPPAATRMVQKLAELKLIKYEKYGILTLEDLGKEMGLFLLTRHQTIEKFLLILGVQEEGILKETEKIEHTISSETLRCISVFVDYCSGSPLFLSNYREFANQSKL